MAQNEITEGLQNFLGGMHDTLDPQILNEVQFAKGVNLTSKGGLVHTRPVFLDLGEFKDPAGDDFVFSGKFQGSARYRLNDVDRLIVGMSGHVYSLRLDTLVVIDHGLLLSPDVGQFFFAQADRYFIVQDGYTGDSWEDANWPVIIYEDGLYDQSALRISNPEQALPKGSIMAYGHGRIFVAVNYIWDILSSSWSANLGRINFLAGDIIKAYAPEDVLSFTENQYLNEGGAFVLPNELGFIQAMIFQRNSQTGTGLGPLVVFARSGASAFSVNSSRGQWKDIDTAQVLFTGSGTLSPYSAIDVNNDVLFRGEDGLRTLRYTVTNIASGNAGLSNDPISEEVSQILREDDQDSLPFISSAFVNNRVFFTTNPVTSGAFGFKGLVSMDTSSTTSIGRPSPPIYDGVWTGFTFAQILRAVYEREERLFAFVKGSVEDTYKIVYLVPDDSTEVYDLSVSPNSPVSRLYTRAFIFQSPFTLKKLQNFELWISKVRGPFQLTAYYRADNNELWVPMSTASGCIGLTGLTHSFQQLRLTLNTRSDCDPVSGRTLDKGFMFQFCIEWTGHLQIDKLRVAVTRETYTPWKIPCLTEGEECPTVEPTSYLSELNDFSYQVQL